MTSRDREAYRERDRALNYHSQRTRSPSHSTDDNRSSSYHFKDEGYYRRDSRSRMHDHDSSRNRRHSDVSSKESRRREHKKRHEYSDDGYDDSRKKRHGERRSRKSSHSYSEYSEKRRENDNNSGKENEKEKDREKKSRGRERDVERDTPSDDDDLLDLKALGLKEISEDDYLSSEFKFWLFDSRGKDLHEMSSDSSHKYFRKFVRRWNDGALRERYYFPPGSARPTHKWSVNSNQTQAATGLDTRRISIDSKDDSPALLTRSPSTTPEPGPLPPSSLNTSARKAGPSRPGASDRKIAEELAREAAIAKAKAERKATTRAALDKAEDLVPKAIGKEGKMAEKKATNAVKKEMRDKDVGGLEADEGTLMGSGEGSFAAALRARDNAAVRKQEKREIALADRRAADEERLADRRKKDNDTMDMLKAMARQRYG